MTAIWDTIGSKAFQLSQNYDEYKANKLRICMQSIYNSIKNRDEYNNVQVWLASGQPNLLKLLKDVLNQDWDEKHCEIVHHIINALHDFDHKDIPLGKKMTFGHHTECVLTLRENKENLKKMKDYMFNDWWEKPKERSVNA